VLHAEPSIARFANGKRCSGGPVIVVVLPTIIKQHFTLFL
jgi:hypothetical protein